MVPTPGRADALGKSGRHGCPESSRWREINCSDDDNLPVIFHGGSRLTSGRCVRLSGSLCVTDAEGRLIKPL